MQPASEGTGKTDAEMLDSANQHGFRPDIEGLRGVAILLVILFHVEAWGFDGGFIGVDVFFVLSGYLITGLLVRMWARTKTRSLIDFWLGRMRRLVPALATVVTATVGLSGFAYSPLSQATISRDAIRALFYSLNLSLARRASDYFAATHVASNPLLHTWSLGVEEQFYVVWPLLILGICIVSSRRQRNALLIAVLTAVTAASFVVGLQLSNQRSSWAFYGVHSRLWELAMGGLLAAVPAISVNGRLRTWLSWTGLAAIGLSATAFSASDVYPGVRSVLPVVGTLLVLGASTPTQRYGAGRILEWTRVQGLGRLSYPLYLWHWPLIAMVTTRFPVGGAERFVGAVFLAFGLAYGTHVFIENPIRYSRSLRNSRRRTFAVVVAIVCVSLGLAQVVQRHATSRIQSDSFLQSLRLAAASSPPSCEEPDGRQVQFGRPNTESVFLVVGDSHAAHWLPALDAASARVGVTLECRTMAGCPAQPVRIGDPTGRLDESVCERYRAQTTELIARSRPSGVILAGAAARYLQLGYSISSGRLHGLDAWNTSLRSYVTALRNNDVEVGLIFDNPYVPFDPIECLARTRSEAACPVERVRAHREIALAHEGERNAIRGLAAATVDPEQFICVAETCELLTRREVVFKDEEHVSVSFSRSVSARFESLVHRLAAASHPT